jgi:hypothetical protein
MDDHSGSFVVFPLEFGVSGFRYIVFDILCTFFQISMALRGLVVVMCSSGGWFQLPSSNAGRGRAQ